MSGLSKLFSLHYPASRPEKPNRRFRNSGLLPPARTGDIRECRTQMTGRKTTGSWLDCVRRSPVPAQDTWFGSASAVAVLRTTASAARASLPCAMTCRITPPGAKLPAVLPGLPTATGFGRRHNRMQSPDQIVDLWPATTLGRLPRLLTLPLDLAGATAADSRGVITDTLRRSAQPLQPHRPAPWRRRAARAVPLNDHSVTIGTRSDLFRDAPEFFTITRPIDV